MQSLYLKEQLICNAVQGQVENNDWYIIVFHSYNDIQQCHYCTSYRIPRFFHLSHLLFVILLEETLTTSERFRHE